MLSLSHPSTNYQHLQQNFKQQQQQQQSSLHRRQSVEDIFSPHRDGFQPRPTQDQYRTREQQQAESSNQICARELDLPDDVYLSASQLDGIAALPSFTPDPMQSDNMGGFAQFTPKMNRFSHQRESSLSSLGSTGPASPFAPTTSNPQIAVTADSSSDMMPDMHTHDATNGHGSSYYQLTTKGMSHYAPYSNLDSGMPELAYPVTIPGPSGKPRSDRALLPAHDFSTSMNRSHPASVASSIAGDSPATPNIGDADSMDKRRRGYTGVPKLARTMTDVYGDELYNPNFTITSSSSQAHPSITTSPTNDIFSQRINAANSQHLSAAHSPASSSSRDRSPFRTGSPLAPSPRHDFGAPNPALQFNSAQRMREQIKAEQDAQLYQQHMTRDVEPETPKTISPKDAILEFHEPDAGESNFPLFPRESDNFDMEHLDKVMAAQGTNVSFPQPIPGTHTGGNQLGFMPSQGSSGIQIPQQYPFIARTGMSQNTPPRLSSAGSSSAGSGTSTPVSHVRPSGTAADGGTYTCTYHGCTQRFETPALLQKHKREGHRQGPSVGIARPQESPGMTSSLVNSQAGPHRCDRINPGTGKPCNTVFSRPYDLTRHEDTIHNARKQKVRCDLCTEEKTFSRADALTRHYRVCHPDVELPGKHRRRGGC